MRHGDVRKLESFDEATGSSVMMRFLLSCRGSFNEAGSVMVSGDCSTHSLVVGQIW